MNNKTKEIVRELKLQRTNKYRISRSILGKLGFDPKHYKDDYVYTPEMYDFSDWSRIDEFIEDDIDIHTMYVDCDDDEDKVRSIVYLQEKEFTGKGNTCEIILNIFNNIDQIYRLREVTDWINQQGGISCRKVLIWDYDEFEVMGVLEV
jgi:hypothetical protein